jgi:hypothetical protein
MYGFKLGLNLNKVLHAMDEDWYNAIIDKFCSFIFLIEIFIEKVLLIVWCKYFLFRIERITSAVWYVFFLILRLNGLDA